MKTTDKGSFIGLAVLMIGLYLIVQLNFLSYYNTFGIPFGRVDVDNYLNNIKHPDKPDQHPFITDTSLLLSNYISPELYLTFLIPIMICIVLPSSVFMLAMLITSDGVMSLFSTLLYVFGTVSFVAFGVSALWGQLLATIFFIWAVIFLEGSLRVNNKYLVVLSVIMSGFAIFSHLLSVGIIALYGLITFYNRKYKYIWVVLCLCIIVLTYIFEPLIFGDYPYSFSISDVFQLFMSPVLWILSLFGIYAGIVRQTYPLFVKICVLSLVVLVISYFSVLWRPLLSVLPFFSIIATMVIFWLLEKIDAKYAIIIGTIIILVMMMFFYNSVQSGMNEMYKEMVPGNFNETRTTIDRNIFKSMYLQEINTEAIK